MIRLSLGSVSKGVILYGIRLGLKNRELSIDIKNRFAYNNIRRKACFSSGLTLESDIFVNHVSM